MENAGKQECQCLSWGHYGYNNLIIIVLFYYSLCIYAFWYNFDFLWLLTWPSLPCKRIFNLWDFLYEGKWWRKSSTDLTFLITVHLLILTIHVSNWFKIQFCIFLWSSEYTRCNDFDWKTQNVENNILVSGDKSLERQKIIWKLWQK